MVNNSIKKCDIKESIDLTKSFKYFIDQNQSDKLLNILIKQSDLISSCNIEIDLPQFRYALSALTKLEEESIDNSYCSVQLKNIAFYNTNNN